MLKIFTLFFVLFGWNVAVAEQDERDGYNSDAGYGKVFQSANFAGFEIADFYFYSEIDRFTAKLIDRNGKKFKFRDADMEIVNGHVIYTLAYKKCKVENKKFRCADADCKMTVEMKVDDRDLEEIKNIPLSADVEGSECENL